MREYEKNVQESQVVTKVICNCCGKEIPLVREGLWEEYFHAEKSWGYLSNQDGRQDSFDLCQECYEKMIESFEMKMH
ncbi:hypothetical protein [Anaerotignum sp.]|uniref:hypothetical protein n=1 Tax=Anaerotignum sp. TaxID=2039241 RepID=UPI002714AC84|nr:hypothetical protein [Anaerotignum sp.]